MDNELYRENLKAALNDLIDVNNKIFSSIIHIAMQGELKEFNDSVPIGETHEFSFELFKNCSDVNIQLLINLMEKVDETFDSIANINNLDNA